MGSRLERPIHFKCKLNEPMHIGMRLLHPAAADHSASTSRAAGAAHTQVFAEEPSRGPATQRWYRSCGDRTCQGRLLRRLPPVLAGTRTGGAAALRPAPLGWRLLRLLRRSGGSGRGPPSATSRPRHCRRRPDGGSSCTPG